MRAGVGIRDLKAAGVSLLTETGPAVGVVGGRSRRSRNCPGSRPPLFGWRVLVPRPRTRLTRSPNACAYGAVRRGADHRGRAAPYPAADGARGQGPGHRAVPVGRLHSVNAVRAVREKLEVRAGRAPSPGEGRRGRQTGRALLDFGIKLDLVPGEQSVRSRHIAFLRQRARPDQPGPLPRADIATETGRPAERAGWETEDVTAYRTVRAAPPPAPIREAIKGGGFDAVLFTSSSTVRNLIGIAGGRGDGDRRDRPADRQDRRGVRPPGGREGAQALGHRPRRCWPSTRPGCGRRPSRPGNWYASPVSVAGVPGGGSTGRDRRTIDG